MEKVEVLLSKECMICMDAPSSILFNPCGHQISCESCSEQILQNNRCCPMCQGDIVNTGKYICEISENSVNEQVSSQPVNNNCNEFDMDTVGVEVASSFMKEHCKQAKNAGHKSICDLREKGLQGGYIIVATTHFDSICKGDKYKIGMPKGKHSVRIAKMNDYEMVHYDTIQDIGANIWSENYIKHFDTICVKCNEEIPRCAPQPNICIKCIRKATLEKRKATLEKRKARLKTGKAWVEILKDM